MVIQFIIQAQISDRAMASNTKVALNVDNADLGFLIGIK